MTDKSIGAAVAAEREACARLADEHTASLPHNGLRMESSEYAAWKAGVQDARSQLSRRIRERSDGDELSRLVWEVSAWRKRFPMGAYDPNGDGIELSERPY